MTRAVRMLRVQRSKVSRHDSAAHQCAEPAHALDLGVVKSQLLDSHNGQKRRRSPNNLIRRLRCDVQIRCYGAIHVAFRPA